MFILQIVRCVHQHRKKIADSLSEKDLQRRIKQEYGFAQQFIAISFAFALTWLLFIFYPKILPENEPKWFVLSAAGVVINSTVNGVVYVRFNREISKELRKLLRLKKAYFTQVESIALQQNVTHVQVPAPSGSTATPLDDSIRLTKSSENYVARSARA